MNECLLGKRLLFLGFSTRLKGFALTFPLAREALLLSMTCCFVNGNVLSDIRQYSTLSLEFYWKEMRLFSFVPPLFHCVEDARHGL
jgi:hypothetical protein